LHEHMIACDWCSLSCSLDAHRAHQWSIRHPCEDTFDQSNMFMISHGNCCFEKLENPKVLFNLHVIL
jgi:hypothetical protein